MKKALFVIGALLGLLVILLGLFIMSGFIDIMDSSKRGYFPLVLMNLLRDPEQANRSDEKNGTPLRQAARQGHGNTTRLLLLFGAKDINTSFHSAASLGHLNTSRILFKHGANINFIHPSSNSSALVFASSWGHEEVVEFLLENGATVQAQMDHALLSSLKSGHDEISQHLLDHGADPEHIEADEMHPFYRAKLCKDFRISNDLSENFCRPLFEGETETAFLTLIYLRRKDRISEPLTEHPEYAHAKGVLTHAVVARDLDIVSLLIARGADLEEKDSCGQTPLLKAASLSLEISRLLIEQGADVDPGKDSCTGGSIIHRAIRGETTEILSLLSTAGADLEACDDRGDTPLHLAARIVNLDAVTILAEKGVNINAINDEGSTPLHHAAGLPSYEWGKYDREADQKAKSIAEALLSWDAEVEARDRGGYTPLHLAAIHGNKETARLLLEHGADVNAHNLLGETPMASALLVNNRYALSVLRKYGGVKTAKRKE